MVNKPDVVTQVPKALFLQNVYYMLGAVLNCYWASDVVNAAERLTYELRLPSAYKHVGREITMDSRQVDYIQKMEGGQAGRSCCLVCFLGVVIYRHVANVQKMEGEETERSSCSDCLSLGICTTSPRG